VAVPSVRSPLDHEDFTCTGTHGWLNLGPLYGGARIRQKTD
jgi:hypothetical protein